MSSLRDIMAKGRAKKKNNEALILPEDPYEKAYSVKSTPLKSKSVGYVHDSIFDLHFNPWDKDHIEKPERLQAIVKRLDETQLLKRCESIPSRIALEDELLLVHEQALIDSLKASSTFSTSQQLQKFASERFYSVYLNKDTYNAALTAAGSGIALSEALHSDKIKSGIALIRPPGHHSMKKECNGFCIFNNAALATKSLLKKPGIKRILIVDIDVHHGQGTQRAFIDNPNVLYFSIHRYEYGKYWPHLKESNFEEIGHGKGKGFNINVPLNETGLGDAEYISILHRILLPMAYEFGPDYVVVSGGYDAAIGCPEGEMAVSPAFYGHLIRSLQSLSMGKLLVLLEGGYFIESLAEGVAMTVRALLGDPCVPISLADKSSWKVAPSCIESILNVFSYTHAQWKQNNWMEKYDDASITKDCFVVNHDYLYTEATEVVTPEGFSLGEDYYTLGPEKFKYFSDIMAKEKAQNELYWPLNIVKVAYVYDEQMMKHSNLDDTDHPESPVRIKSMFEMHDEFGLLDQMVKIQSERRITNEEISLVHGSSHIEDLDKLLALDSQEKREKYADEFDSIFFNSDSHDCAHFAAGAYLDLIDAVLLSKSPERTGGIAMIRPPGHHAEPEEFMGFSILNNVALGAAYAKKKYGLKKILIFDWDVHHGNGIQKAFYNDPSVLYISIHRFDEGSFYPCKDDADVDFVGEEDGKGYNVNIPWNGSGVGDSEYLAAFMQIVMPIAYEYEPELVLISAGFDAAINDPLGHCKVSPEMYGHMTHHLSKLANGKVILALEGGYNLTSLSLGMVMCTKALLGHPLPMPNVSKAIRERDAATIRKVLEVHEKYWYSLKSFSCKIPLTTDVAIPNNLIDSMNNLTLVSSPSSSSKSPAQLQKEEREYIPFEYGVQYSSSFVNTMSSSPSTMKSTTLCSSSKNK